MVLLWRKEDTVECFPFSVAVFISFQTRVEIEDLENFVHKQEVVMTYHTHTDSTDLVLWLMVMGAAAVESKKSTKARNRVCLLVHLAQKKQLTFFKKSALQRNAAAEELSHQSERGLSHKQLWASSFVTKAKLPFFKKSPCSPPGDCVTLVKTLLHGQGTHTHVCWRVLVTI